MQVPDLAAARDNGKLRLVERDASTLLRLTRRPATEPYFGRNKVFRFDDPLQQYGVTYAARSLEVAFAETVLHERVLYEAGAWIGPASQVRERSIIYLDAARHLLLADLTGPSLKALGLDNQVSAGLDYTFTWAISRALHEAVPEFLMYRDLDPDNWPTREKPWPTLAKRSPYSNAAVPASIRRARRRLNRTQPCHTCWRSLALNCFPTLTRPDPSVRRPRGRRSSRFVERRSRT